MKKSELRVLVTAGPTRAYLDDFRFLSNYSTGEMGLQVCTALKAKGVQVALVSGPCEANFERLRVAKWSPVETHAQMLSETLRLCKIFRPQFVIFSAAVLDFEPARRLKGKTTSKASWTVRLKPTKKIIEEVRKRFPEIQRIGFKLEPGKMNEKRAIAFAEKKMREQDLWTLCLNYRQDVGRTNHKAMVMGPEGLCIARTKRDIAKAIVGTIC